MAKKTLRLKLKAGLADTSADSYCGQVHLTFRGYDEGHGYRERVAVVTLAMDELPGLAREVRKAAEQYRDHAQRILDGVLGKA